MKYKKAISENCVDIVPQDFRCPGWIVHYVCGQYARGEPILRMTGVDGQHASAGFALP